MCKLQKRSKRQCIRFDDKDGEVDEDELDGDNGNEDEDVRIVVYEL